MTFKSDRLHSEFETLNKRNPQLCEIILDISDFSVKQLNKEITITSIYRSAEEQKAIYGYEKPSVHMYWRGVDLRSSIYKADELKQLLEYVNNKYEYDSTRPDKYQVALFHNVGAGNHLHIQNHANTQLKKTEQDSTANKVVNNIKSLIGAISYFIR